MPDGSLINLGELSKPINTLVEKISSAAGILYEPTRIKRKALADAEAKKTQAIVDLEISDLQKRAMHRFLQEETIKQENIESIVEKSFDKINDTAEPENIEDDWIANFFDKSKFISDNNMQELWSKILAGESNKPGTYSKRTIEVLSNLDKSDAVLFTNLCKFVWSFGELQPLIFDHQNDIYNKYGINFSTLMHLDEIGLISFNSTTGFLRKGFRKNAAVFYYGRPLQIEFNKDKDNQMQTGNVLLTSIGKELALIANSNKLDEFYDYVVEKYHKDGLKLSEPLRIIQNNV